MKYIITLFVEIEEEENYCQKKFLFTSHFIHFFYIFQFLCTIDNRKTFIVNYHVFEQLQLFIIEFRQVASV